MQKSRILASQTRPETLPKSIQNRYSKKHTLFLQFFNEFCHMLQWLNLKIRAPTQCFVDFSHKCPFPFLHNFLVQKASQKPFQNEVQTMKKSMSKTYCFSTSIFHVLDCVLEGRGPSSWSQVGCFGLPRLSQSVQNPAFWEQVSKMLPKKLQSSSKRRPKRLQEWIFGRFLMDFNAYIVYIYQQKSRYERHLTSTCVLLE